MQFRAIVSDVVIAFALAYVAYVTIQRPVANLVEMLMGMNIKFSTSKYKNNENSNDLKVYKNNNLTSSRRTGNENAFL